jgi:GTPase
MENNDNQKVGKGRLLELSDEKKALIVGVYVSGRVNKIACEGHLEELSELCYTYGVTVEMRLTCPIKKIDAKTYIGSGKVDEISSICDEKDIDVVVFDEEISPHQQRNLEKEFKIPVIDRTELILGVFEKRASTKEAKIQVELAKLRYELPRLKRMWTHLSRQRTGGSSSSGSAGGSGSGYLKGEGERQIEIDKRILKAKINKLQKELEEVKKHRSIQRVARQKSNIPTFAIIGYTNAGKSTLMNALTDANVFVEDKLFATLDTTTRRYILPNEQEILLIDTVGFIRKIPHTLVAAFKSTLEESLYADILIHLVDIASDGAEEKVIATHHVLQELQADNKPMITCFNKIDTSPDDNKQLLQLVIEHPHAINLSAKENIGIDGLLEEIQKKLSLLRKRVVVKIPQSNYSLVSLMMREGKVISREYVGNDIMLEVDIPIALESTILKYIV